MHWQPTSDHTALRARATLLKTLREFFLARDVLEVETPSLANGTLPDPHIESLHCDFHLAHRAPAQRLYLQTSPEFHMKRLLAAGSGSIYQICKAFRNHEAGRYHNPEFTLLEWYRVGYDHHDLMDEVSELLCLTLTVEHCDRITYQDLFKQALNLDPLTCTTTDLRRCLQRYELDKVTEIDEAQHDLALQLLLSHVIEPTLGQSQPMFIYDYPRSQAALANIRENDNVAERFEVYYQGIELANGFHELTCPDTQLARFREAAQARTKAGLPKVHADSHLIAALDNGLPPSAGVALGVDRLLMLMLSKHDIQHVLAFPTERA